MRARAFHRVAKVSDRVVEPFNHMVKVFSRVVRASNRVVEWFNHTVRNLSHTVEGLAVRWNLSAVRQERLAEEQDSWNRGTGACTP